MKDQRKDKKLERIKVIFKMKELDNSREDIFPGKS